MSIPPIFIPEGHIDKALTRTVVGLSRQVDQIVNRKQGCTGVARAMQDEWKKYGSQRRVIGMVDDDKKFADVAYLTEFSREVGNSHAAEASHSIRRHPARPTQYLIVLAPACDTWIWQAAVQAGLVLAAYQMPETRREFVSFCKGRGKWVGTDPQMLKLLDDIRRNRPDLFVALAGFVTQIMKLDRPLPE